MTVVHEEELCLSASQIDTYRLCQRKWAWSKLDGLKAPPNRFAQKGLDVDDVLTRWLSEGTPIDAASPAGKIAMAGVKHLPSPSTPGLATQKHFLLRTRVVLYQGKKDVEFLDADGVPCVYDHKTTTDFKWAKTAEQLRVDVQANLYAADAISRYSSDLARLRWIYYRTTGQPKSLPVSLEITRPEAEEQVVKIDETAREIIQIYAAKPRPRALDLLPNPDACEAFGGCPYRSNCNLSPREMMRSMMAQESAIEKMRRLKSEKLNGGASSTSAAAPAPVVPPPAPPRSSTGAAVNPPPQLSLPVTPPPAAAPPPLAPPAPPAAAPASARKTRARAAGTDQELTVDDHVQAITAACSGLRALGVMVKVQFIFAK